MKNKQNSRWLLSCTHVVKVLDVEHIKCNSLVLTASKDIQIIAFPQDLELVYTASAKYLYPVCPDRLCIQRADLKQPFTEV